MFTAPFPIAALAFPYLRPLVLSGAVDIANTVAAGWTTIASEVLGQAERAVISGIGLDVTDNGVPYEWASGSLEFRLAVNDGVPINWGGSPAWTSKRGSIEHPTSTLINVQPGSLLQIQARRIVANDSGARTLYALVNGLRWPITINHKRKPTDAPLGAEAIAALLS